MRWIRRQWLSLAASLQGPAVRNVRPYRRAKPSGIPFKSKPTGVAAEAGLTDPVVYGGTDSTTLILEAIRCGCASLDYDNDGWQDVLLSGARLEGRAEDATVRSYKNNCDGTFRDVTEEAGVRAQRSADFRKRHRTRCGPAKQQGKLTSATGNSNGQPRSMARCSQSTPNSGASIIGYEGRCCGTPINRMRQKRQSRNSNSS